MLLQWMPEVSTRVDDVAVAAAMLLATKDSSLVKVRDDALGASLCYADLFCDFAQGRFWRFRQANEYVRVVTKECPMRICHERGPMSENGDYRTQKTGNK